MASAKRAQNRKWGDSQLATNRLTASEPFARLSITVRSCSCRAATCLVRGSRPGEGAVVEEGGASNCSRNRSRSSSAVAGEIGRGCSSDAIDPLTKVARAVVLAAERRRSLLFIIVLLPRETDPCSPSSGALSCSYTRSEANATACYASRTASLYAR